MTWRLDISPQAENALEKLEDPVSERIKEKLLEVKENVNLGVDPDHYFKFIKKYRIHRLRVGAYRIFTDIDKNNDRIMVITVNYPALTFSP